MRTQSWLFASCNLMFSIVAKSFSVNSSCEIGGQSGFPDHWHTEDFSPEAGAGDPQSHGVCRPAQFCDHRSNPRFWSPFTHVLIPQALHLCMLQWQLLIGAERRAAGPCTCCRLGVMTAASASLLLLPHPPFPPVQSGAHYWLRVAGCDFAMSQKRAWVVRAHTEEGGVRVCSAQCTFQ